MAVRTNASGGGGLDTDDLTALAGDVLKGKTAGVKGSDDPVAGTLELTGSAADSQVLAGQTYYNTDAKTKRTGTMPNNGAQNAALNCGQTKVIPAGYTTGGTVTANSLASQTGGVTADDSVVRTGKTYWRDGVKRTGTMPVQGAETNGDRAWATQISCGEGNANFGVRNGHRLEGVNWIRGNIPNFTSANIKKGVNMGGLVGTFEGYVPTQQDLYLRGNNIFGFRNGGNNDIAITFATDSIIINAGDSAKIITDNYFTRPAGISYLHIECDIDFHNTPIGFDTVNKIIYLLDDIFIKSSLDYGKNNDTTKVTNVTFDISKIGAISKMAISMRAKSSVKGKIYRIWTS